MPSGSTGSSLRRSRVTRPHLDRPFCNGSDGGCTPLRCILPKGAEEWDRLVSAKRSAFSGKRRNDLESSSDLSFRASLLELVPHLGHFQRSEPELWLDHGRSRRCRGAQLIPQALFASLPNPG